MFCGVGGTQDYPWGIKKKKGSNALPISKQSQICVKNPLDVP